MFLIIYKKASSPHLRSPRRGSSIDKGQETPAWDKILQNSEIQNHLKTTNVFIASHHGHLNGYHENVFLHCISPDCVVISDKDIMYDTQDGMATKYSQHVPVGIGDLPFEIHIKISLYV